MCIANGHSCPTARNGIFNVIHSKQAVRMIYHVSVLFEVTTDTWFLANNNYTEVASAVLAAVGGKENVKEVGYCATRLRFEVKDNAKVDEKAVKAAGAAGVIRPSKNACQVIIGTKVQFVYDELKKML